MITITLNPHTPEQLARTLRLLQDMMGEAPAAEQPAAKPAVVKAAPAPEPEPEPAAPAAPVVTLEALRERLAGISKGQKAAVMEVLKRHGASKLTDLTPDKYAAVMAETEALA